MSNACRRRRVWQIYQDMADNFTDNPLAGFEAFRRPTALRRGMTRSCAHAGSARVAGAAAPGRIDGRLPQVSFIIADAAGSEHPGPPARPRARPIPRACWMR
jgi:phospholipase C